MSVSTVMAGTPMAAGKVINWTRFTISPKVLYGQQQSYWAVAKYGVFGTGLDGNSELHWQSEVLANPEILEKERTTGVKSADKVKNWSNYYFQTWFSFGNPNGRRNKIDKMGYETKLDDQIMPVTAENVACTVHYHFKGDAAPAKESTSSSRRLMEMKKNPKSGDSMHANLELKEKDNEGVEAVSLVQWCNKSGEDNGKDGCTGCKADGKDKKNTDGTAILGLDPVDVENSVFGEKKNGPYDITKEPEYPGYSKWTADLTLANLIPAKKVDGKDVFEDECSAKPQWELSTENKGLHMHFEKGTEEKEAKVYARCSFMRTFTTKGTKKDERSVEYDSVWTADEKKNTVPHPQVYKNLKIDVNYNMYVRSGMNVFNAKKEPVDQR